MRETKTLMEQVKTEVDLRWILSQTLLDRNLIDSLADYIVNLIERDKPTKIVRSATAKTICPFCQKVHVTWANNFCPYCGHRLGWSEE